MPRRQDPDTLPADIRVDYDTFMALPAEAPVWVSEPVRFFSEWRYYVQGGHIIGRARYDTGGSESAPRSEESQVLTAIKAFGLHP